MAGSWRTEFAYDGQSRRVGIVEQVREDSGWTTESSARYLWEGTEIIQKRDATGSTVTARYYDQGEIRVSGSTSVPSYFTRDHLGSVREVVNQSGVIAQSFDYTAWGERTSSTAGSLEWGFTGHHYHEKSGLHLAMFRAYDGNLGRWLSEDPIGEAGGLNLYGYVGNGVANAVDPLGLDDVAFYDGADKGEKSFRNKPFLKSLANGKDFERAAKRSCKKHAYPVSSPGDMIKKVGELKKQGVPIDSISIFDHGGPGRQEIGNDRLPLDSPIFEAVAKQIEPGGYISFFGCECGKNTSRLKSLAEKTGRRARAPQDVVDYEMLAPSGWLGGNWVEFP